MPDKEPCYRRILVKVSGEALMGERSYGIDPGTLADVAREIRTLQQKGIQVAAVIGGGNIFRGLNASDYGIGRVQADHMGMLATVINGIALGEAIKQLGVDVRVMTAVEMDKIAEPYVRSRAVSHLEKGKVVVFVAGTGNPFFTTDTAATLRSLEVEAGVFLKATKVDGVYDRDPVKDPSAKRFSRLTYEDVLKKNLKVMDLTAVSLARDQGLPIVVFDMKKRGNIERVVFGEDVGTTISGEKP